LACRQPSSSRFPPTRYGALWLAIAAELDDEFFGMGARPMRSGSFTLLCHCVLHAPTLGHALRRALRFLDVVLDDPRGELVVRDGLAEIELGDAGAPRSAFAYRTYWIILHGIICWLVGRRIPIRLVDFRCAEPRRAPTTGFSSARRCVFTSHQPSRLRQRPAEPADFAQRTALKQFLRAAPANILVRYRYDAGIAAAVRRRLNLA
jgi:hypothetical protein